MSVQAVAEFFIKANTDVELQQEVTAALDGKEIEEAATNFAQLGAKYGYEFTAQDAIQKYQEIVVAADGELSDEALEQVAGGGKTTGGAIGTGVAVAGGLAMLGMIA